MGLRLRVGRRETVAADVVVLDLRRDDDGELPEWSPGAHLDLILGADLERQYSLCGDPADRSVWRVAVLRENDGRGGSAYVHDRLAEDEWVGVRGPRNHFALAPAPRYLFLAGGIGIAPIVPMLAAAEKAGAEWGLHYGGRTRASMAFRDELVERYGDRVTPRPRDEYGLLDLDGILGAAGEGTAVYCCGPEPLLAAVEDRWSGPLHVERFRPIPRTEKAEHGFEVELTLTGKTVFVPPGRTILQVADEAGALVSFSCREGTCGTCETPVLEGEVDHRDSLLTEQERAANNTMFICCSRAAGDRLVLEL